MNPTNGLNLVTDYAISKFDRDSIIASHVLIVLVHRALSEETQRDALIQMRYFASDEARRP